MFRARLICNSQYFFSRLQKCCFTNCSIVLIINYPLFSVYFNGTGCKQVFHLYKMIYYHFRAITATQFFSETSTTETSEYSASVSNE